MSLVFERPDVTYGSVVWLKVHAFLESADVEVSDHSPVALPLNEGVSICFQDCIHNEINNSNNNKHSLKSNTKGYGGKTH
jgi:hypothetical protein